MTMTMDNVDDDNDDYQEEEEEESDENGWDFASDTRVMYVPLIAKQPGILCPGHPPNNLYPDPHHDENDNTTYDADSNLFRIYIRLLI